jgi:hypothetical protein
MKLNIINIASHRNGICGAPFHAVIFHDSGPEGSRKLAIVFDEWHSCAVLDIAKLHVGDIAFGSNTWRGDDYEAALRRAIEHDRGEGREADMNGDTSIAQRVDKCDAALRQYSDDEVFSSLTDLLADAMHWSDATGGDFHFALCLAGKHYLAELNDQPTTERKRP